MLVRDTEHTYRDQKGADGVCRVRVFAPTAASDGLPVVIVTEHHQHRRAARRGDRHQVPARDGRSRAARALCRTLSR